MCSEMRRNAFKKESQRSSFLLPPPSHPPFKIMHADFKAFFEVNHSLIYARAGINILYLGWGGVGGMRMEIGETPPFYVYVLRKGAFTVQYSIMHSYRATRKREPIKKRPLWAAGPN